jgi:hypothetical protein
LLKIKLKFCIVRGYQEDVYCFDSWLQRKYMDKEVNRRAPDFLFKLSLAPRKSAVKYLPASSSWERGWGGG